MTTVPVRFAPQPDLVVYAVSGNPSIVFTTTSGRSQPASTLADQMRDAWPNSTPPRGQAGNFDELDGLRLTSTDIVVIIIDAPIEKQRLLGTIEMLDELGIAVAVVMINEAIAANEIAFAGATAFDADATPEHTASRLSGILDRQPMVRRLKQEVTVSQRFQGGLRGQIDRFHEELQLAAMVQREFLPSSIPSLHGVELDALWRPANYVSGDLYNVLRLDEDHLGIFIADAVGHGVPAALMTMIICRSLKPKRVEGDSYALVEPSEVMARLNEGLILRQGVNARFATGVYAQVNCRARTMKLAGAGHPVPLLLRQDGSTEELHTNGGLLGIFENEEYDQIEVTLNAGDRLVLYSDGFEQAFPDPEATEEHRGLPTHRYREEFEALRACSSATDMIETIQQRIDDQAGSLHQLDDVTLVTMLAPALAAAENVDQLPAVHFAG